MQITFNPAEMNSNDAEVILKLINDRFYLETYDASKQETKEVRHISLLQNKIILYTEDKNESTN